MDDPANVRDSARGAVPGGTEDLARQVEAVLFVAPRPVPAPELAAALSCDEAALAAALADLAREYAAGRHGIELREVAGGFTFAVADECAETVRRHSGLERPDDLSPALLETLSLVAYLEPVTRAEVAEVRGVSSEWTLATLEERGLIEERGRAATPGAPILYATTERFLQLFGLRSRADLPPLEEFALGAHEVDEIRARLHANAARRRT